MSADLADRILAIRAEKSNPVPVYVQIADEMRGILRGGTVAADTELPSERLLCEAYGVSRMTLRQALGILQREGLIECQRGRGTFVSVRHLQKQQQKLRSFTEEMRSRGVVGSTKLISFRLETPTAPAREFFVLGEQERVYSIERLRLADGTPIALEAVQVPRTLCPNLDRFDLVQDSLYRILEEEYGLKLADCLEEISAIRPSPSQRKLLEARASAALLSVWRRTRTTHDVPAEFAVTTYRGDLYTAVVRSNSGSLLSKIERTCSVVC